MDQGNKKRMQFDSISTASEMLLLSVKIIFRLLLVTIMEITSVFPFTTLRIMESQSNGSVTLFVFQDARNNTVTNGGIWLEENELCVD